MIIDTHAHYIEPDLPHRPYVDPPKMEPISVDEIAQVVAAAGVDRILQVTASTMGYDNRYSFEGAQARPDKVIGVIGRVDPIGAGAEDRLAEFMAQPMALGVRITFIHDWSAGWLRERALDRFLKAAGAQNVPIHLFAPGENALLIETIRRFPEVRFVIDHMGTRHVPGLDAERAFAHWPLLLALSDLPNVWIKVSHFPEAASGSEAHPWPTALAYFRRLYDHAGPRRLLWGSNFPPVLRACSYQQAVDFVRRDCDFLPEQDKADILGGNFLRDFISPRP